MVNNINLLSEEIIIKIILYCIKKRPDLIRDQGSIRINIKPVTRRTLLPYRTQLRYRE